MTASTAFGRLADDAEEREQRQHRREDRQHGVVGERGGQVGALVVAELAQGLARDVLPGPLVEVAGTVRLGRRLRGRASTPRIVAHALHVGHRRRSTRPATADHHDDGGGRSRAASGRGLPVVGRGPVPDLGDLRLRLGLHVSLADSASSGAGELLALLLDLGLDLLGRLAGHRRSSLHGGDVLLDAGSSPAPARASRPPHLVLADRARATPATAKSTTATIRAAAQAGQHQVEQAARTS